MYKRKRCITFLSLFAIAANLILVLQIPADTPPTESELKTGPFGVGFRSVEMYDYSRTYRPQSDYFGNPYEGETARPLQICVWYPIDNNQPGVSILYGEYISPYPENTDFLQYVANIQNRGVYRLIGLFNNNMGRAVNFGNLPSKAKKGILPVEGSFPLLIYIPNLQSGITENAAMLEYLTSYGYIIAAGHPLGTKSLNPRPNRRDLDTQKRDMEFIIGYMRGYQNVDNRRVGIIGTGYGALSALLISMSDANIGAVTALDRVPVTEENNLLLRQAPFFDFSEARTPLLHLCQSKDESLISAVIDSLHFSATCVCECMEETRISFSQYGVLRRIVTVDTALSITSLTPDYVSVCSHVLEFFNHCLKSGMTNIRFAYLDSLQNTVKPGFFKCNLRQPSDIPPSPEEYLEVINVHGVVKAVELNQKFNLMNPINPIIEQAVLNNLGYQYLNQHQITEALQLFEMCTQAYPGSANAWDSYAEAQMHAGNNDLAIKYYRKALEILPSDSAINENFRETIRNGATQALERLQQNGE